MGPGMGYNLFKWNQKSINYDLFSYLKEMKILIPILRHQNYDRYHDMLLINHKNIKFHLTIHP